jgi:hypothetical protein
MRIAASILLLTGLLGAQNSTFELPSFRPVARSNGFPFAGSPMRYQQWYSGAEWRNALQGEPMRVLEVAFKAGGGGTQQAGQVVELEITMAHGPSFGPLGFFDANLARDKTVVVPRRTVPLGADTTPGTFPLVLPFAEPWVWDGESSVVLDVRIFSNGNQNQPFNFSFDSTETSVGRVQRLFTVGNPFATDAATIQDGWGLMTRFTVRPGVSVDLPGGVGCPGAGGFVPQATSTVAFPPTNPAFQTWDHTLTAAASQRPAVLIIGLDKTMWVEAGLSLPHELLEIGAKGCFLLVDPLVSFGAVTTGGGAGAGTASISIELPPSEDIIGFQLYSQWLVSDPGAPNSVGSATSGLWHIVGPFGG